MAPSARHVHFQSPPVWAASKHNLLSGCSFSLQSRVNTTHADCLTSTSQSWTIIYFRVSSGLRPGGRLALIASNWIFKKWYDINDVHISRCWSFLIDMLMLLGLLLVWITEVWAVCSMFRIPSFLQTGFLHVPHLPSLLVWWWWDGPHLTCTAIISTSDLTDHWCWPIYIHQVWNNTSITIRKNVGNPTRENLLGKA